MKNFLLTLFLALSLSLRLSADEAATPFKDGDRWCVLGDSITHGGLYHKEVELFYLTRFPEKSLEVINCGIAGDTARGALKRLGWDCLDHKPSVVSVMLGMNDVGRSLYDTTNAPGAELDAKRAVAVETYRTNMAELTSRITNSGARLILITPSIFDDTGELRATNKPGCAAALTRCAHEVESLAVQRKGSVVDFNGPMTEITAAIQKTNASATIIGGDRVHPGPVGHFIMAYEVLKAQKTHGEVSLISVDAVTGKSAGCEGCEVTEVKAAPNELSFSCLEKALPYPVTDAIRPALQLVPFMNEFNREILKVTGLKPGSYGLSIDELPVRAYTAEELAGGVNLTSEQTPQVKQALGVQEILKKKWDAAGKLRNIAAFEYRVWPDAPHSGTSEEQESMKLKIQAYLGKAADTNSVAKGQEYNDLKIDEAGLKKAVIDAATQAHVAAKPIPHHFIIKKTLSQAP